jgi:hypothetical protein
VCSYVISKSNISLVTSFIYMYICFQLLYVWSQISDINEGAVFTALQLIVGVAIRTRTKVPPSTLFNCTSMLVYVHFVEIFSFDVF